MVQVDWGGVLLTLVIFNPRYWLPTILGIFILESVRIVFSLSVGGILTRVVLGGVLGYTQADYGIPWIAKMAGASGPLLCLLPLLFFYPKRWAYILFAWKEVKRPYRIILFRLGLINLALLFFTGKI
ncbi:MAG: hypothetical protein ACM3WV_07460 [Bacillota bacterium]